MIYIYTHTHIHIYVYLCLDVFVSLFLSACIHIDGPGWRGWSSVGAADQPIAPYSNEAESSSRSWFPRRWCQEDCAGVYMYVCVHIYIHRYTHFRFDCMCAYIYMYTRVHTFMHLVLYMVPPTTRVIGQRRYVYVSINICYDYMYIYGVISMHSNVHALRCAYMCAYIYIHIYIADTGIAANNKNMIGVVYLHACVNV